MEPVGHGLVCSEWEIGDSEPLPEGELFFDGNSLPIRYLGKVVDTPVGPGVYVLDQIGEPRVRIRLGCERDGCLRYIVIYLGYNGTACTFGGEVVADLRNEGFVCSIHAAEPRPRPEPGHQPLPPELEALLTRN